MTEVLLINSPVKMPEVDIHARMGPPLGLGYIGAVLLENGFEVEAIDMNVPNFDSESRIGWGFDVDRLLEKLRERIVESHPMMVGISTYTETYLNALRIARIAKEIDQQIITVLGGPHVTFLPTEALKRYEVDIVVRNEGEYIMLELARFFRDGFGNLDEIKGISFRKNGTIISNPARPFIKDLDVLPFPARHLFPLNLYPYPGNVVTARGCPGRCIFCAAVAMSGGSYRMRSSENVVSELVYLLEKHDLNYCVFVDDTFTSSHDRTMRICDLISEAGLDIHWSCTSRVNTVTKEMLKRMAEVGCDNINFGVESGSQRILDSIRKGITLKQMEDAVKWALESGITPICSFMFPHPDDTEETIKETKKLMEELLRQGCHISIAVTTPFPGTYLYTHAEELGVTIISDNWEDYDCGTPVIATRNFSQKDIYKLYAGITGF